MNSSKTCVSCHQEFELNPFHLNQKICFSCLPNSKGLTKSQVKLIKELYHMGLSFKKISVLHNIPYGRIIRRKQEFL